MGWRREFEDEVAVGQSLHLPQHGPLLIGAGAPAHRNCDIVLECAQPAGVHARLEIFWKGRKPWSASISAMSSSPLYTHLVWLSSWLSTHGRNVIHAMCSYASLHNNTFLIIQYRRGSQPRKSGLASPGEQADATLWMILRYMRATLEQVRNRDHSISGCKDDNHVVFLVLGTQASCGGSACWQSEQVHCASKHMRASRPIAEHPRVR